MRTRSGMLAVGIAACTTMATLVVGASAADMTMTGELSNTLGWSLAEEQVQESQTSYELEIERDLGFGGKVHLSWDGSFPYGLLLDRQTSGAPRLDATLYLDEAYVDVYLTTTDLRIGRQVVSWGTADGFNPTNVVNPKGALSPSDMELKGEPVPAVKAAYYLPGGGSLTGVAVLDFVPSEAWMQTLQTMADSMPGLSPNDVNNPSSLPRNERFEFAGRAGTLLARHNVYASYFTGWDDNPVAWIKYDASGHPNGIATKFRRVQKFGLATAGTLGDSAVWTEVSYTLPEELGELEAGSTQSRQPLSSNDPYVEAVMGGDYTFDGGVTTSAQVVYNEAGSLLSPFNTDPGEPIDPQTYIVGTVQYSPSSSNQLELTAIANASDGSGLVVPQYTHDLNQLTSLTISVPKTFGGDDTEFGLAAAQIETVTVGLDVIF